MERRTHHYRPHYTTIRSMLLHQAARSLQRRSGRVSLHFFFNCQRTQPMCRLSGTDVGMERLSTVAACRTGIFADIAERLR